MPKAAQQIADLQDRRGSRKNKFDCWNTINAAAAKTLVLVVLEMSAVCTQDTGQQQKQLLTSYILHVDL